MKLKKCCLAASALSLSMTMTTQAGTWKTISQGEETVWCYEEGNGFARDGWYWIDGNGDGTAECYYFDSRAWLLTNTTTPDGYQVDENGAWVVNGVVQTKAASNAVSNTASSQSGSSGSDTSVFRASNNSEIGNWNSMTASEQQAVTNAIEAFKQTYITEDMSDFEKEIMILRWLVENCKYQIDTANGTATAYGCIVNGKAQCAGYADAFLQTAKACGLNVRYVRSDTHAWNVIELDGDWYHVDPTWEDAADGQGFLWITSAFINLTDDQVRELEHHKTWTPAIECNGSKYGQATAAHYIETGEMLYGDVAAYDQETKHNLAIKEYLEDFVILEYTNDDDTVAEVEDYLDGLDPADLRLAIRYETWDEAVDARISHRLFATSQQWAELGFPLVPKEGDYLHSYGTWTFEPFYYGDSGPVYEIYFSYPYGEDDPYPDPNYQ